MIKQLTELMILIGVLTCLFLMYLGIRTALTMTLTC